jgi:hypothetical protein
LQKESNKKQHVQMSFLLKSKTRIAIVHLKIVTLLENGQAGDGDAIFGTKPEDLPSHLSVSGHFRFPQISSTQAYADLKP